MTAQEPKADSLEWNAWNHNRQLNDLKAEAEKRFWTLKPDETGNLHGVYDQLGRELYPPSHLMSLRGFFAGLPAQA